MQGEPLKYLSCTAIVFFLCILTATRSASACSIDGLASLSVNGNIANTSDNNPDSSVQTQWAPFTLPASAPHETLHFTEDMAKLSRVLPFWAFSQPFQWRFDDGTRTEGRMSNHSFRTLGWHTVRVFYYWPAHKQWIQFDAARIHILPAAEVWKANLGYEVGKLFQSVMRVVVWGALAAIPIFGVVRYWKLHHSSKSSLIEEMH